MQALDLEYPNVGMCGDEVELRHGWAYADCGLGERLHQLILVEQDGVGELSCHLVKRSVVRSR